MVVVVVLLIVAAMSKGSSKESQKKINLQLYSASAVNASNTISSTLMYTVSQKSRAVEVAFKKPRFLGF